jgi:hypothetical protein
MALTQVKTSGLADDAVTEAKVANDAISPAEMKAGTDGHIITYDASGNPTTVGPGNDGQVLTSTGAGSPPAFEDAAATVGGASAVTFNDSVAANFGTDGDQAIWHTGSVGYIRNSTGGFCIRNDAFSVKDDGESETMLTATKDGSVDLYYDNAVRIQTTAAGATISKAGDSAELTIKGGEGEGAVLMLSADEADDNADNWRLVAGAGGSLNLQNYASGSWENNAEYNGNGNVELYYDNSKKFETTDTGASVTGALSAHGASFGDYEVTTNRTSGSNKGFVVKQNGTMVGRLCNHGSGPEGKLELYNGATQNLNMNGTAGTLALNSTIKFGLSNGSESELGDYETGSWTPTVRGTGTVGTASYSKQVGKYTKIGNLCTVWCCINFTSGNGSDYMKIGPLPFTSENTTNLQAAGSVMKENITHGTSLTWQNAYITPNSTEMLFYSTYNNSTFAAQDYEAAGEIIVTITYRTA